MLINILIQYMKGFLVINGQMYIYLTSVFKKVTCFMKTDVVISKYNYFYSPCFFFDVLTVRVKIYTYLILKYNVIAIR